MFAICEDETPAQGPAADAHDEHSCPRCGARLTPDGHFCGWCGQLFVPGRDIAGAAHVPAGHFLG